MSKNTNLHKAKNAKKDDFYTQLADIAHEVRHYKKHFEGKVVYCNCDDPRISGFFKYFSQQFIDFGLKKLIASCYKNKQADLFSTHEDEKAVYIEYTRKDAEEYNEDKGFVVNHFEGDGDFRSEECIELLKQADIVVTNPPFSLFREYVAQLITYDKKFIILGDQNATTYKEIFKLIKENRLWLGVNNGGKKWFGVPDDYDIKTESRKKIVDGKKYFSMGRINWYTNLDIAKRHETLSLVRSYEKDKEYYPKYDNYDAIEVSKVAEIPEDYGGAMGVPITFLDKFNPDQFEILSSNDIRSNEHVPFKAHGLIKDKDGAINGVPKYVRIVIKNKLL